MSETPASPRASRLATPGWLDGRLVLGVLLVLVSVVVGARVLSAADRSTLVYALNKDLAAGSEVLPTDVTPVRVRLFENAEQYVNAARPLPGGYVLRRAVGADELLPLAAVTSSGVDEAFRLVSVPVQSGHFPPGLDRGVQVDVWMTPDLDGQQDDPQAQEPAGEGAPAPADGQALELRGAQLVLQAVTVEGVGDSGSALGGSTAVPVVLRVAPTEVAALVSAMSLGQIDLVRVPRNAESARRLEPATGSG